MQESKLEIKLPKLLLGSGFTGQVFAHPSNDSRVIKRQRLSPLALAEATFGSKLVHPNLMHFDEVKLAGPRQVDMVMARAPRDLFTVMTGKTQSYSVLEQLITDVACAIHALHGQDLIHLDVKPENVIVLGEDRSPELWKAQLLDFGSVLPRGTRYDIPYGTPGYRLVATPRAEIKTFRANEREDWFAFTIMALQLLLVQGLSLPLHVHEGGIFYIKDNQGKATQMSVTQLIDKLPKEYQPMVQALNELRYALMDFNGQDDEKWQQALAEILPLEYCDDAEVSNKNLVKLLQQKYKDRETFYRALAKTFRSDSNAFKALANSML